MRKVLTMALLLGLVPFLRAGEGREIAVKGTISGAVCAAHGMLCPSDPDHMKKPELLGIYTEDGKFYYLANVPQDLLMHYGLQEAEVKGELFEPNTILVKDLKAKGEALMAEGKFVDPMGHKVDPEKAVEIDGRYWCPDCAKMKQGGGMY